MALLEIVRRLSTTQVEIGRHARPEGRAPDVVADVAPGHPTQPLLGLVERRADRLAGMPAPIGVGPPVSTVVSPAVISSRLTDRRVRLQPSDSCPVHILGTLFLRGLFVSRCLGRAFIGSDK